MADIGRQRAVLKNVLQAQESVNLTAESVFVDAQPLQSQIEQLSAKFLASISVFFVLI